MFYVQRIPDQLTGPFVEVGTVFQRSPSDRDRRPTLGGADHGCDRRRLARALRRPRRRLAGLIPLSRSGFSSSGLTRRLAGF